MVSMYGRCVTDGQGLMVLGDCKITGSGWQEDAEFEGNEQEFIGSTLDQRGKPQLD